MRNADRAGRESAGWEPIARADKAAAARAQPDWVAEPLALGTGTLAEEGPEPKVAPGAAPPPAGQCARSAARAEGLTCDPAGVAEGRGRALGAAAPRARSEAGRSCPRPQRLLFGADRCAALIGRAPMAAAIGASIY